MRNSTAIHPSSSKACCSSNSLHSVFSPVLCTDGQYQVEQYFDFAFGLADQIYAMMRGEIVYEGQKSKISKAKLRKSVGV